MIKGTQPAEIPRAEQKYNSQDDRISSVVQKATEGAPMESDERVTARTYRTMSGEVVTEYIIDGVAVSSVETVKTRIEVR